MLDIDTLDRLGFFRHVPFEELPRVRAALAEHGLVGLQMDDGSAITTCVDDLTRRFYFVDGENLAEGTVLAVLGWLAPFLRHEGVPIETTFAKVRFPAIRQGPWGPARPKQVGSIGLDADGWLAITGTTVSETFTPVESLRLATRPGGELEDVTEELRDIGAVYVLRVGTRVLHLIDPESADHPWDQCARSTLAFINELLTAHGSPERAYGYDEGNNLAFVLVTPAMAAVLDAAAPSEKLHDGRPQGP